MSISEYGDLTPRELTLIVEEHNFGKQQKKEDMILQAYYTAAWQRAKRMPKLDKVLEGIRPKNEKPAQPQTPEQMLSAALRWQAKLERGEG